MFVGIKYTIIWVKWFIFMLTKKLSSGVERGGESSIVTNPSGGREGRGVLYSYKPSRGVERREDSGVERGGESSIVTNPSGGREGRGVLYSYKSSRGVERREDRGVEKGRGVLYSYKSPRGG